MKNCLAMKMHKPISFAFAHVRLSKLLLEMVVLIGSYKTKERKMKHIRVQYCIALFLLLLLLLFAKQGSPFRGTRKLKILVLQIVDILKILLIEYYTSVPIFQHIKRHKKGQVSYFPPKYKTSSLT